DPEPTCVVHHTVATRGRGGACSLLRVFVSQPARRRDHGRIVAPRRIGTAPGSAASRAAADARQRGTRPHLCAMGEPAIAPRLRLTLGNPSAPPVPALPTAAGVWDPDDSGGSRSGYKFGPRIGATGDVYEAEGPGFTGRIVLKLYPRAAGVGVAAIEALG